MAIKHKRDSANARGYTYRWQCERAEFLRCNPFCRLCHARGALTVATVVDHTIPHKGNKRLFWDRSNWQSLCKHCHDAYKQRAERASYAGAMRPRPLKR